uniref:Phosphatase PAP2 family protein n=1 Tax=Eiseniibacteriota bacterium TaxID=2212470 RepID=A0A832I3C2_UNCEI
MSAAIERSAPPQHPAPAAGRAAPFHGRPGAPASRAPRSLVGAARATSGAAARTLVVFALAHLAILATDSAMRRDLGAWNVFAMIEAQRLVPALGEHPLAPALSACLALAVFGLALARGARGAPPGTAPGAGRNGHGAAVIARPPTPAFAPWLAPPDGRAAARFRPGATAALGVAAAGVGAHMASLALVERMVPHFPAVPDVLQARLPYVNFGAWGEMAFVGFAALVTAHLLRRQRGSVPAIVVALGVFYALRGLFLLLLPLGSPPTAPALDERFVLYPYAAHAYFPGGHTGLMTVLSLAVHDTRRRRALLAATAAFAFGTVLARTHYTADALGGALFGYAVVCWSRRHLAGFAPAPRGGAPLAVPAGAAAAAPASRAARVGDGARRNGGAR